MRSSNSKLGKSVSICSDPLTENGPCSKKEEELRAGDKEGKNKDGEVHAVAARFVDDVVRLASATAGEKAAILEEEANQIRRELEVHLPNAVQERRTTPPERLPPSIFIDTVPSMPPSPTEWPPPPPEDIIYEEDETIENIDEELSSPEEIQKFAANYISEVLIKAMEIAEQKQKNQDEELVREVASQVVQDVIQRASESAVERLTEGLTFPDDLPSIQIDTVVSMPPSPEEEDLGSNPEPVLVKDNAAHSRPIPEITYMPCDDEEQTSDHDEKTVRPLIKFSEAPEEVKEFAVSYVKEIIAKAITAAEEKIVNAAPFNFEDGDLLKVNGPWYIRMREAMMRVLRSACFCTPRRDDS